MSEEKNPSFDSKLKSAAKKGLFALAIFSGAYLGDKIGNALLDPSGITPEQARAIGKEQGEEIAGRCMEYAQVAQKAFENSLEGRDPAEGLQGSFARFKTVLGERLNNPRQIEKKVEALYQLDSYTTLAGIGKALADRDMKASPKSLEIIRKTEEKTYAQLMAEKEEYKRRSGGREPEIY